MPPVILSRQVIRRFAIWMAIAVVGAGLFLLGINPDIIGMNRSRAVGFVQIGAWLLGLAVVLVGGFGAVRAIRQGRPTSLRADIGLRLIATGYVAAATASLADFIGIGSHFPPQIYFGPLQRLGLVVGIGTSLLGVVLYLPIPRKGAPPPEAAMAPSLDA